MTTVTTPAATGYSRSPRNLSLAWNTWRRHRLALSALIAGFAGAAVWLAVAGFSARADYRTYVADGCLRHGDLACQNLLSGLTYSAWTPAVLPWIVGIVIAAPLMASEFDARTYRFSAVQGVSLRRQTGIKLLLLAVIVVAGGLLLGLICTWSAGPWHLAPPGSGYYVSDWFPGFFATTALTLPAIGLLDLCIGALAGTLFRRVLPVAMAVAAAGVLVLAGTTTGFAFANHGTYAYGPLVRMLLRADVDKFPSQPEILQGFAGGRPPPLVTAEPDWLGNGGRFEITGWYQRSGKELSPAASQALVLRIPLPVTAHRATLRAWLNARHVTYWIGYQPVSRFWLFQAVLAALLIAAAMVLGTGAVLLSGRQYDRM